MTKELDTDNLNMLKELLGEKFIELVNVYISDSQKRLEKLRGALEESDFVTATHEVHGLKGSSRNIGAHPLAELCEVMEGQARNAKVVDKEQQLAAIEQKLAALCVQLRTFL